MAELANCKRCGKVFAKHIKDICQECFKEEEADFDTVYRFLRERENQEATLQEIAQHTGVSEGVIIKFIKNKRLRTSQFPKLSYPCERCGTGIVTGILCDSCSKTFLEDLESYEKKEKEKSEQKNEKIYYSLNNKKR